MFFGTASGAPVSSSFLQAQPSAAAICSTASYHCAPPLVGLPATFGAALPPSSYYSPTNIMPPFPPSVMPSSLPPPHFGTVPGPVPMLAPSFVAPPSIQCAPVPAPVPVASQSTSTSSKRRFKEEKEDDTSSDDLLGYQVVISM